MADRAAERGADTVLYDRVALIGLGLKLLEAHRHGRLRQRQRFRSPVNIARFVDREEMQEPAAQQVFDPNDKLPLS